MHKGLVLMILLIFGVATVLSSCAEMSTVMAPKPSAENFMAPIVTIDSVQLRYYDGFWVYGDAKVALGEAPKGGGSSAISIDFIFNIENSNAYPVKLDSTKFFLCFEDYELQLVTDSNPMWIPAGMTNTKVISTTLNPMVAQTKPMTTKAKNRGIKPIELVQKWWTQLPDMSFPIHLTGGTFTFTANGLVKPVPYQVRYP